MSALTNPLAAPWSGPFGGVPPWDALQPAHVAEAFSTALAERQREVDAIAGNPVAPTFGNTIEALERSGQMLDRVIRLFAVACENVTTAEYQSLAREWLPRVAASSDAVLFNRRVFERIEAVHRQLPDAGLAPDQARLVTLTYDHFVRHGARLGTTEKTQLTAINQELETLFTEFRSRVLADENTWITLTDEAELAGLPPSLVAAAAAAAQERGLEARWAIVNTRSSVDPFLTFSRRRDLRERVWRAFKQRGDNDDDNDTKATIVRIVALRAARAALLGYPTHAYWHTADSMARTPAAARDLMQRVWPHAVARVHAEVAAMKAVAATASGSVRIEPWDYLYFAEQIRKAKYDIDQAEVKPYFELNNMVAAAIWSAERRFGLVFTDITGQVPTFHPDVRVWHVTDADTGDTRALFYLDNFARAEKKSGAWASNYREFSSFDGVVTAIVSNNNNFVKAPPGEPVLISLDDVRTLFHEFGHALHGLLQNVRYPGLGVTPTDFIEFPSQLNEEWMLTEEVLERFARHHETGEPLPPGVIERIRRARTFNQGYATVEYLAGALLDMALHMRPTAINDVAAFEQEELAAIGMPREVALRHRLTHFDHLFGSDYYAAGYYSYLWAEVLSADAWQALLEASGPWDRQMLRRLRDCLLADGNTVDRADAYRRFRGRDPDIGALLQRRGLLATP
jgi:peptidyl-dipeptidase Dcp